MPLVPDRELVVDARGLAKDYGARRAVVNLTLAVARGECLGLLGPNGAGKTTTIKMVTCYTTPSAGELAVFGLPMRVANHAAIKARLGIVQQEESLDPDLSVEKNLTVYASYFGIARGEAARRAEELIRFAELCDHRRERIRLLSGGMKRRLMLARALVNDPALLVLDEPTTGLDPQARRLVWERIRSLARGSRFSSPPTTWRRRRSSATGSSSWTRGGSSPRDARPTWWRRTWARRSSRCI
jgi:lipooligosaccharide transport system ATP-binding protein